MGYSPWGRKNARQGLVTQQQQASSKMSYLGACLVAQRLKRLPGMQEAWFQSLGQEDPLEKEMATHSSTLDWRIPWAEDPGGLQSIGSEESDTAEQLSTHKYLS